MCKCQYLKLFICYVNVKCDFFFSYFQLKPVCTTGVPAAAAGSSSSFATDLVPPLLVLQCSSSSLGSGGNKVRTRGWRGQLTISNLCSPRDLVKRVGE